MFFNVDVKFFRVCFFFIAIDLFSFSMSPSSRFQNEETYSLADIHGVPFDHKLLQTIGFKNGVFVEVGAHDGITQSNTYLLEKNHNWSGILIEPSSSLFKALCVNRPKSQCYNCALGTFEQNNTHILGDFDGCLMSSIGGKRLNRAGESTLTLIRSLQSVLDEANISHVNLFSLDVEGYEYQTLLGVDFERTVFDYLLIEIYAQDFEKICALLDEKGYDMLESFSLYDSTLPDWDGTHNDYLFKRKTLRTRKTIDSFAVAKDKVWVNKNLIFTPYDH